MQYVAMTEEQQDSLETNGYLIVPGVLGQDMIERLSTTVDRLYQQAVREEQLNQAGAFELRNCIAHDDAFLPLLDWPATVALVPRILGWNIQLDTSHVIVRPPRHRIRQPHSKPSAGTATAALPSTNCRSRCRLCA